MQILKRALPVIVSIGAAAAPATALAQDQRDNGRNKERCECLRSPELLSKAFAVAHLAGHRARLGVMLADDSEADSIGARVEEVMDDSPAEKAGLEEGDIITHLDGKSLVRGAGDDETPHERLIGLMREVEPGDTVRLDYRRDGSLRTATVVADERSGGVFRLRSLGAEPRVFLDRPGNFRFEVGPAGEEANRVRVMRRYLDGGMRLEAINPGLAPYFGTGEGVLVLEIDEDSGLELRPGDVILRIGARTVDDAGRVHELLDTYRDGEEITIEVMRNKQRVTVTGER